MQIAAAPFVDQLFASVEAHVKILNHIIVSLSNVDSNGGRLQVRRGLFLVKRRLWCVSWIANSFDRRKNSCAPYSHSSTVRDAVVRDTSNIFRLECVPPDVCDTRDTMSFVNSTNSFELIDEQF